MQTAAALEALAASDQTCNSNEPPILVLEMNLTKGAGHSILTIRKILSGKACLVTLNTYGLFDSVWDEASAGHA